jgi:hypothetical protein
MGGGLLDGAAGQLVPRAIVLVELLILLAELLAHSDERRSATARSVQIAIFEC